MTKGEAVDVIINKFRALTQDKRLSRRYVLAELEVASKYYIEQKVNEGNMMTESLFKEIKCLEMVKSDRISCPMIELRQCKTLMRSKEKLPKVLYSGYGPMIREVSTIDDEKVFKRVTKQTSRRRSMRPVGPKSTNFHYLYDGEYLWIPEEEVHAVNLKVATFDDEKVAELNKCGDSDQMCKSGWEYDMMLPETLLKVVIEDVTKSIAINRQIPIDENPNMSEREG